MSSGIGEFERLALNARAPVTVIGCEEKLMRAALGVEKKIGTARTVAALHLLADALEAGTTPIIS